MSSCSVDYVHDDVANFFVHEVDASISQSYENEEVESYVSNDHFDVSDPTFHEKVIQDDECKS